MPALEKPFTALHLFSGSGGGALGFKDARARVGRWSASFHTLGGIDVDQLAAQDFENLVRAPCLAKDVAAVTVGDMRAWFGPTAPDVVLSSPPCRSFSGLLPRKRMNEPRYRKLSGLVLAGVNLVLASWATPPRILFIENVPNIMARGAEFLIKLRGLLRAHGYATSEGTHDCGALAGLGQHRKRWFMVARHRASCPSLVYHPVERPLVTVGDVLSQLPSPASGAGGPMNRLPRLERATWDKLVRIPAGEDGRAIGAKYWRGTYGVCRWDRPSGTVTAQASVSRGAFSVADPRIPPAQWAPSGLSEAGAWHRPFSTLELAALQGFPLRNRDGTWLQLAGESASKWRARIGNAIPPPAARVVGEQLLSALLAHRVADVSPRGGSVWCRRLNRYEPATRYT